MRKRKALALLNEAVELLSSTDFSGERAVRIYGPEDSAVQALCEQHGYGAVMDSAARQWFLKAKEMRVPGSSFTIGPCARTVELFLSEVQRAKESR